MQKNETRPKSVSITLNNDELQVEQWPQFEIWNTDISRRSDAGVGKYFQKKTTCAEV